VCNTDRAAKAATIVRPCRTATGAFFSGWLPSVSEIFNSDYVQVRHTSSPAGVAETLFIIGGTATLSGPPPAMRLRLQSRHERDNKLEALVRRAV
jgi:hypothetical protein